MYVFVIIPVSLVVSYILNNARDVPCIAPYCYHHWTKLQLEFSRATVTPANKLQLFAGHNSHRINKYRVVSYTRPNIVRHLPILSFTLPPSTKILLTIKIWKRLTRGKWLRMSERRRKNIAASTVSSYVNESERTKRNYDNVSISLMIRSCTLVIRFWTE